MQSLKVVSIVLLSLLIAGCVRIRQEHSDKRFFVLSATRPDAERGPVLAESLAVQAFRISPRYERGELVYRKGELEYESDFYNQFFVSPEILIAEETRKWVQVSGLFRHVVAPAGSAIPAYLLEGMVTTLHGDFRGAPKAVMEVQFFVVDGSSVSAKILLQKDYRKEVPISAAEPRRLAEGFSAGLKQILGEFETDLREALRQK